MEVVCASNTFIFTYNSTQPRRLQSEEYMLLQLSFICRTELVCLWLQWRRSLVSETCEINFKILFRLTSRYKQLTFLNAYIFLIVYGITYDKTWENTNIFQGNFGTSVPRKHLQQRRVSMRVQGVTYDHSICHPLCFIAGSTPEQNFEDVPKTHWTGLYKLLNQGFHIWCSTVISYSLLLLLGLVSCLRYSQGAPKI
jgi:hypothetical protein